MMRPLPSNHPTSIALHRVLDGGNQIVRGQNVRPAMLPRPTLFVGPSAQVGAMEPAQRSGVGDKVDAAYDWTTTLVYVIGMGTLLYFAYHLFQQGKTSVVVHKAKRAAIKHGGGGGGYGRQFPMQVYGGGGEPG